MTAGSRSGKKRGGRERERKRKNGGAGLPECRIHTVKRILLYAITKTVVAILLVDNSDTKRTQYADGKEFYKVISRDEIAGKYNKSYECNKEELALKSRDIIFTTDVL